MKNVVERKALGDVAIKVSVGWRDADGSVHVELYVFPNSLGTVPLVLMILDSFTVAYDASSEQELQLIIDDIDAERDTFVAQVDRVLPGMEPPFVDRTTILTSLLFLSQAYIL